MKEKININFWDDFYEDEYIPEGKIQQTYVYIESEIALDKKKECLEFLLNYMKTKNLIPSNTKWWIELYDSKKKYPNLIGQVPENMFFIRWELKVEHLTHKQLDKIINHFDSLEDSLIFENKELNIYSES